MHSFGGHEVEGQAHRRPKLDLEASFLTPVVKLLFC